MRLTPAERRRSQRIHVQIPMFVRGTDAAGLEFLDLTKTLDISATGAYLASRSGHTQQSTHESDDPGSVVSFRDAAGRNSSDSGACAPPSRRGRIPFARRGVFEGAGLGAGKYSEVKLR